ncbi:cytochrome c biogenesis protein CcsA [Diaphorobacter sp. HDW4B]|uniref:cytochrome C assembly family protein n=1 Tax=Diaphorobacter sp. HDW4B TaxID=2714925 RepID=UPI00140C6484|nr:cytochrome c biogenesis protein CcsA [Diaphorobacter sp. HDW4B]QIL71576.1 cytochrome c biogenesis protein CcsA [Diaphorobacter sp. HDW4B]
MILPSASPLGWLLALAAAVAYVISAIAGSKFSSSQARAALIAAWVLHGISIAWGLMGESPHFGFASALSMTAWLMLVAYLVERQFFPQLRALWVLSLLGAAIVLLAVIFPGKPLHALSSPWLPLHLTLGIASYGLFAAAVVHAWLMTRAEKQIRLAADSPSGMPLLTLERLTFRFVTAGFVVLTATLVAGWFFGEVLYGRAWIWDHKSVFSVLSWITFAVLLIGRSRFGWRGHSAVRMLYAGAALLLLAYAGSRFVMEVLLARAGN